MSGDSSLEARSKMLDMRQRVKGSGENGIGLRLDMLVRMAKLLDEDKELLDIFGSPVSSKLAVFSNGREIGIVDAGAMKISDDQRTKFLDRLKETYAKALPHDEMRSG
ncbi:MAG: hypothetical protein V1875_03150 [Candidatus Altiarchaeota archaeon]